MKEPLSHVNYYKRALLAGCTHNLKATDDLALALRRPLKQGAYITRVFDTYDPDGTYNRLIVEGNFEGAKLEVIAAVSDYDQVVIEDELTNLEEYLSNPKVDPISKAAVLQGMRHVRMVNTKDILLHSLQGRYIWVYVGISPAEKAACRLEGIRLEFPRETFLDYFPEIYGQNDTFDRFVAILQSLYLDIENKVETLPGLLDYESAPENIVLDLAAWLGLDNNGGMFSTEQMRHIIRNIEVLQGGKGTRAALEQMIELATGVKPRIIEQFQLYSVPASRTRRAHYDKLYGQGPNCFCIILDLTGKQVDINYALLDRLIRRYSPIGTIHKLVVLGSNSHLDMHCYLDVNGVLSTPETASADGFTLGGYITVG